MVDAKGATRSVMAGQVHLKVARDAAKERSEAMVALKAIIVSVPSTPCEELDHLTGRMTLLRQLAALRPGRPV
ncbi:hypothetical protein J8J14_13635 [Roseomonas sp. SSH11]|uniref:Uncharacterized protein n=1 Tax=Pararoseomonas baculiformis TaxID=2820812 RepID=A0ABS4AFK1_9PROT|nr:hypothetical protein [Pararoseomonas baculiformis]MBP0445817.1 hypothetical protein [Pararoseomonas baculiformis]